MFVRKPSALYKNIIVLVMVYVVFVTMNIIWTWDVALKNIHLDQMDNISCYYLSSDCGLASAEDLAPPDKAIFFIETSCRGGLNSRQACAVESATRAHPKSRIYVLFTTPIPQTKLKLGNLAKLLEFSNIEFARVKLLDYVKGSPLENMIVDGAISKSLWRIPHTSDLLRYLTLSKWGGVYLDLDTVVVKPFDSLASNWAARESDKLVAAGAMSFSNDEIGRAVADAALRELKTSFRGDVWAHNGPGVITRVLKNMCSTKNVTHMSAVTCQGFEVYNRELFYPVKSVDAADYFKPGSLEDQSSYVYHVWNHRTQGVQVTRHSLYANLAEKYCPTIYTMYGDNFGL